MSDHDNPLLMPWTAPLEAPPFDRVRAGDFLPAFSAAVVDHDRELAAIRSDPAPADFDNSLAALERAGEGLARVRRIFGTLSSAQADPAIRSIEADVSALLTRHGTSFSHDPALYARVAAVHAARDASALTPEQRRLVENVHDGFVAGGAALDEAGKARLAEIDQRLSGLSVQFGQNVLAATNAWTMPLDAADLDGLPDAVRVAAASRAEPGHYLFTLDRTDFEAFLTFSARRYLRERMWHGFTGRCDGGAHDNNPLIAEMLALRDEKARLLGYPDFASFKLEDSMAATPDAAQGLLERVWEPAKLRAAAEAAELQGLIDADGGGFALAPWDWRFYAERIRRDRFDLDGAALKQYLRLGSVRTAAFEAAGRLYGLQFVPRTDVPVYHPDVDAWEVRNASGDAIGLVYTDYL
ncbi:MAG: peptidyl-dipeptidase Dcp, partial [Rhizorhabdus sp.]|nr:peptidyl-dipeptidase Dcp [Rhizorhabdus sp.]